MNSAEIQSLVDVALGKEAADLVLSGGTLLNVYTAELIPRQDIAIKGQRIAYVGPDAAHTIGPTTHVLDVAGRTLIPGLIDGHTHQNNFVTIAEYLRYIIPGGTTTLVTETESLAGTLGFEGTRLFLESLRGQPIKVYALASACVPINPAWEDGCSLTPDEAQRLLEIPQILGVGEVYWTRVIDGDERTRAIMSTAHSLGKPVEGHSAGAKGSNLAAYIAAGVTSCHEPITKEETLERLRLGLHVMLRQGAIRQDLPTLAAIKDEPIDTRHLVLATDSVAPPELVKHGYLDHALRQAIALGWDPVKAIQMATLNVAEHFHLDRDLGGIAPGRFADILVIPDVSTIRPEYVISNGVIVAAAGKVLVPPRRHEFPPITRQTIHIDPPLTPSDFLVRVPADLADGEAHASVRVAVVANGHIILREERVHMPVVGGTIAANPAQDILKIVVVSRHNRASRFVGFARGFGLRDGAFASSISWDANNLIAVGARDDDIAGALNRIVELGGGLVVHCGGRVIEELPLPLFGVTSDLAIEHVADRLARITRAVQRLGSDLREPLLTLQTSTFTALPYFRITNRGFVDIRARQLVGLFVDAAPADKT